MNSSARNKIKRNNNSLHKSNTRNDVVIKNKKISNISNITHSIKRHSKNTLRKVLLSKMFHKLFNFFIIFLLIVGAGYGIYSYFNKSFANNVIVSKSEIIERVAKLTSIPDIDPDAVVRVEDAEILKKQNSFYENVKSGDYIVMYPKLAIIYDLRNNSIVAIKKTE